MTINRLQDSSYAEILKILQEGTLQSQLSESSEMWNYVQKNLRKYAPDGKKLVRSLLTKRGFGAVGNIGYNGSFKAKKEANFAELVAEAKFMTAHIEIPWSVYNAGKSDKGAFARPMAVEIEDKQTALAKVMTRQLMSDGSGILGKLTAIPTDNGTDGTFTISSANGDRGCIRWIEINDELEVVTSLADDTLITDFETGGAAAGNYLRVISVDEDAGTFVASGYTSSSSTGTFQAGSVAANMFIVKRGAGFVDSGVTADFGDASLEMTGLESLIDDSGLVHGLDRATVTTYKSGVVSAAGGLLATDHIQQALTKANKLGDGKPSICVMSHNTYNRFVEIAEEDRRLVNTKDGTLGYERIGYSSYFGNVKFVVELYSRDDRIFLLDPKYLELYGNDFSFFEENGVTIRAATSSSGGYTPDYSSELIGTCEMFCCKPSAMARVENYILS